MKYASVIVAVIVGLFLGWQLHGYLRSLLTLDAPQLATSLPDMVDLRTYQTEQPVLQSELKAPTEIDLESLLQESDYAGAIAIYNQQQATGSEQELQRSRQLVLQHALFLHQSRHTDQAMELLNTYLGSEFRDVDALRIKARLLADLKDHDQLIDVLYEAKSYAYREPVIAEIERALRAAVDVYKQQLLKSQRYAELLALFQKLVYLEPEYPVYFIELARAQRLNHLEQQARQSLELVMFDPDVGGQAQRMLEELNVTDQAVEQRVATIDEFQGAPLIRRGSHFVVEATLNGSERLKLIIDTGASLTIIKPERLRSSINENLDRYPTYRFSTANGVVRAPVLKVSSLAIAEFEVANMEVGGLALINTEGVDGLLGMNFLKHFRFFIDQQNNVLRLALNREQ